MIIRTMRAGPIEDRLVADALQTLQDDSTAGFSSKAGEVPHPTSMGLSDSLWAVTAHLGSCPQIARPSVLISRGQTNQSVSMVGGMALGMHQIAFEGGQ